jgi:hypothetical protein
MGWSVAGISLQRVELNHSDGGEAMSMGDTKPLQMPRSFLPMRRPSRWAISVSPPTARGPGRTDSGFYSLFFQVGKNLPGVAHPYICLPPTRHEVQAAVCPASTRICPPPTCICPPSACHLPATCTHLPATGACLPATCLPLACHIGGCPPLRPPPFCPPCPMVGRVVFGVAPLKVQQHTQQQARQ